MYISRKHKINRHFHFKKRVKERYGIDINKKDRKAIQGILNEYGTKNTILYLGNRGNGKIVAVYYKNQFFIVVYDRKHNQVITALTEDMLDEDQKRRLTNLKIRMNYMKASKLEVLKCCVGYLNATNKAHDKKARFKELYDSGSIDVELWSLIYNFDVLFHITSDKVEKNFIETCGNSRFNEITDLLKELNNGLTGNRALKEVSRFIKDNEEYRKLIYDVLDKDLHIGMSVTTMNTIVPGLFKDFQVALAKPIKNEKIDEHWMIEHKLDGCFAYNTPITLADGTTMKIGEIVEKKLPVEVLSYNEETKQVEPKRVVNWFNNGVKTTWVEVKNKGYVTTSRLHHKTKLVCTDTHKFFDGNGYTSISSFEDTQKAYSAVIGVNPTQKQIILGSVMGDGCLAVEKRCKSRTQARLHFSNGYKQKDYFDKKRLALSPISGKVNEYTSGYGSLVYRTATRTIPYLNDLYNNYSVEYILNHLSLLGLAIWYMDDGSRAKDLSEINVSNKFSRAKLATYAYTLEENKQISFWLNSKGYDTAVFKDNRGKGYWIDFRSEGSQKFFKDIAPYIPLSMEYKLPSYLRGGPKIEWWKDNNTSINIMADSVEVNYIYKSDYAYDIEVEDNHNYFASGMLVHNCRCICYINSADDIKFYSRKGKDFTTLGTLKGELKELIKVGKLPTGIVLDGEICVVDENGNEDFKSVMQEIKRKDYTMLKPMYILFDTLPISDFNAGYSPLTYKQRFTTLKTYLGKDKHRCMRLVDAIDYTLENFGQWQKMVFDKGWEGLILRNDVPYEGDRSSNMLKVKSFQDAEYVVKDVEMDGDATVLIGGKAERVKCVKRLVIEHKGNKVGVGSGLKQEQRLEWYQHPEHIIGRTITVRYFEEVTDENGKPSLRFPTLKYIYDGDRDV